MRKSKYERESVWGVKKNVCVCVWERERDIEKMRKSEYEREWERGEGGEKESVCACERERERGLPGPKK